MKVKLNNLCTITTWKLDVNAHNPNGAYPFFTCARENYSIDIFAFDGESILIAWNGDLNVKYYNGKFNAYQRTYVLQNLVYNWKYLFYAITNKLELLRSWSRWSTIKYIRLWDLQDMKIPLVSLPHQTLIVDEIEKQLSRLDSGLNSLQKLQTLVKQYRASVFSSAVSGKLVPQDPSDEPASLLLERILEAKKEKRLAENPGKKYKEPSPIETSELGDLPDGWCWCNVNNVCMNVVDCLHSTPKFQESWKYCIDTTNIKPWKIVMDKIRYVNEITFQERIRRLKPQLWDVLFSREGALLWVAVYVKSNIDFCLWQRIMMFRTAESFYWKFFEIVLNSEFFKTQYKPKIWWTASPHLNIVDIKNFIIPFPPLSEQQRIVSEVERRFSVLDKLEQTITDNITRANQLKQSILHQAFSGQLVDYNDDPTEIESLLIQIEQAKDEMKKKVKKK